MIFLLLFLIHTVLIFPMEDTKTEVVPFTSANNVLRNIYFVTLSDTCDRDSSPLDSPCYTYPSNLYSEILPSLQNFQGHEINSKEELCSCKVFMNIMYLKNYIDENSCIQFSPQNCRHDTYKDDMNYIHKVFQLDAVKNILQEPVIIYLPSIYTIKILIDNNILNIKTDLFKKDSDYEEDFFKKIDSFTEKIFVDVFITALRRYYKNDHGDRLKPPHRSIDRGRCKQNESISTESVDSQQLPKPFILKEILIPTLDKAIEYHSYKKRNDIALKTLFCACIVFCITNIFFFTCNPRPIEEIGCFIITEALSICILGLFSYVMIYIEFAASDAYKHTYETLKTKYNEQLGSDDDA